MGQNVSAYPPLPAMAFERPEHELVEHQTSHVDATRTRYAWASLRLAMGAMFFWAFVDKLLGLGFATAREAAWVNGGSPTRGFLTFGTSGPLAGFYEGIAGHPVTDAVFMLGLVAIGLSLLVGVGVRIAGYSGALLVLLMWSAALPPANHPVLDDHVVYAVVLLGLTFAHAGRTWGLGASWSNTSIVRRYHLLE